MSERFKKYGLCSFSDYCDGFSLDYTFRSQCRFSVFLSSSCVYINKNAFL